jgi:uncharacterized protein (TIGR00288 family)
LAGNQHDEQRIGLFIDFENIAIGVRDAHYRKFDINLVLERLLEKGKLLIKRAYADWSRYADYKRSFHEAAIELIEVPQKSLGGKNSADIRLVVDAMDMSFQKEHVNCFVIASGDSDFSPLVSKLKENNKYVIGLGVKNSTSDLLMDNCDEFIFYEDLVRGQQQPALPQIAGVPEKLQEAFGLLVDSVLALQRENKEILWGSMVKETMKRKKPSFNETYYGFRTFSHLLEDAQRRGLVLLRRDQKSGSYIVDDLGPAANTGISPTINAVASGPSASTSEAESANGTRRRRRGRGRRGRSGYAAGSGAGTSSSTDEGTDLDDDSDEAESGDSSAEGDEGGTRSESYGASDQPRDNAASPAPHEPAPERSAFSFLSWLRREPPPTPREPESPPPADVKRDET